ncbi:MAG: T9SS type A sorting domain-containing protein [Bacteroidota bacterium]
MKKILLSLISVLLITVNSFAQTCDYFNYPNTTTVTGWTEQAGDWSVSSNTLAAPVAASWNWITNDATGTVTDGCITGRATYSTTQLQFMGLTGRYTTPINNIMLKVQDNGGSGYWDSWFLYCNDVSVGNMSGQNYGSDLNFKLSMSGANVTIMIDKERDGVWEFDSTMVVSNTGAGLCGAAGYSLCYLDDWCYNTSCCTLPDPAGTISGTSTVCAEDTITYNIPTVANATSYHWQYTGFNTTVTGTTENVTLAFGHTAGSGVLTVHGVNACGDGTVSASFPITVNPLPDNASSIGGADTVCQGQSYVYNCGNINNAVNYMWTYTGTGVTINGNAPSVQLVFASNATSGNLSLMGENACGNGGSSPLFPIVVESCLGIDNATASIQLYPNPGTGVFTLNLTGFSNESCTISIENILGQNLYTAQKINPKEQQQLDLSARSAGTYVMKVSDSKAVVSGRLVIER